MRRTLHTATLGALALALGAAFALPLHAQDRSNDQRDQTTTRSHQAAPNEHRTQQYDNRGAVRSDQRQVTQDDTRGAVRSDEERASREHRRGVARTEERREDSDDVSTLRHAHPRAAARCHDGFFTNTRDRARACSKHGGIEIWLAL